MLGVAATLLTLVLERRRELSMLRLIGAARRQVQRVVVIEAALIGAASQAIGLVVGLALSVVLVYVINVQSFGWTIQFQVPMLFLLQVSVAGGGRRRRWPASIPRAARRRWSWSRMDARGEGARVQGAGCTAQGAGCRGAGCEGDCLRAWWTAAAIVLVSVARLAQTARHGARRRLAIGSRSPAITPAIPSSSWSGGTAPATSQTSSGGGSATR